MVGYMAAEPNNRQNRWYQKQNHVRLAKKHVTKAEILADGMALVPGGGGGGGDWVGPALATAATDPSVFAADGAVVIFEPLSVEYMYQDLAGTVPVTNDGDPVGSIRAKNNASILAVAPDLASRGIVHVEGDKVALRVENDQWFITGVGEIAMDATDNFCLAVGYVINATSDFFLVNYGNVSDLEFGSVRYSSFVENEYGEPRGFGFLNIIYGTTTPGQSAGFDLGNNDGYYLPDPSEGFEFPEKSALVMSVDGAAFPYDPAYGDFRRNGLDVSLGPDPTISRVMALSDAQLAINVVPTFTSNTGASDIYSICLMKRVLTGTERTNMETYLASLMPATVLHTPVIEATSKGQSTATTSHAITLPSGIVAGDLLLVVVGVDGFPTLSVNTGISGANWNELTQDTSLNAVSSQVYWKIAEGGDALTLTTGSTEISAHICYRISGAQSVSGSVANGSSTDSNPPIHTPPGGPAPYLWIATRAGDNLTQASAPPPLFNGFITETGPSAGASVATASRGLGFATSLDPGTFTSATEQWVSYTIAVEPVGL